MPDTIDDKLILDKFAELPEQFKQQVVDFMDFLLTEKVKDKATSKKAVFGSYKGTFKMSEDFNEPLLDDFKDYMP